LNDEENEANDHLNRGGPGLKSDKNDLTRKKVDFTIWKKPAQKSMRETSVEMWLTSFPFVRVPRAREVSLRERL
jgi:hypothetical protein